MNKLMVSCLLAALSASSAWCQAQTVWRCGPDGRSYSDAPCAGGQAVLVADARTVADVAEARVVALRDQRLARQMVIERRERERETLSKGSGLMAVGSALKPTAALTPRVTAHKQPLRPKARHRSGAVE